MIRHLPNFLTCCNLLCGTLGIIYIMDDFSWSNDELTRFTGTAMAPAIYVWAACLFDFLDGFAARALKVTSSIGKELDSLADMVSFGLLPALFMFKFIEAGASPASSIQLILPYAGLFIAVFSAMRLAIFNVDETQRESFRGLPTPANTLFITGLPFLPYSFNPWILAAIAVVFSLLLVSRVELFALKFKDLSWSANRMKFTFLIVSVVALLIWKFAAIPVIIILYIALSLGKKAIA